MANFSVLMPFTPSRPEQAVPYAAFVQHRAHRLWQGQSLLIDPHQTFSYLAGIGFRIPVGTGVTLMPFRHPFEAALHARSMAAAMRAPVVAGFGPGGTSLQASLRGAPYPSPIRAAREYLTIVRALLASGTVSHAGEYFTMYGSLPPLPAQPVELGLGVLRPRMARLAGEVADIAVTWLTPSAYVGDQLLPALREGATAAGRATPRLAAIVPVAVSRPERESADLAAASNSAHLNGPHYRDMLRRAGIELGSPSDLAAGARALVDGGAFVYGEPAVICKELDAYRAAGVDEIVLNLTGVCVRHGIQAGLADLEAIFNELTHE